LRLPAAVLGGEVVKTGRQLCTAVHECLVLPFDAIELHLQQHEALAAIRDPPVIPGVRGDGPKLLPEGLHPDSDLGNGVCHGRGSVFGVVGLFLISTESIIGTFGYQING
jgi:hypothetical protein